LVTGRGYDSYVRRIVIPLEGNLYGRSISTAAPPHRFLPGAKGGLYAWAQAQSYPEVILVEGLFDYAVLWQAGFHNVTCSLGTHLNARQFGQLSSAARTVYVAFDADVAVRAHPQTSSTRSLLAVEPSGAQWTDPASGTGLCSLAPQFARSRPPRCFRRLAADTATCTTRWARASPARS
jgi:hypothetical protein